jgi:N6-adenosine-specific RNA methylase IME4
MSWCGLRKVSSGGIDGGIVHEQNAVSESSRKRMKSSHSVGYAYTMEKQPPLILSPSSLNEFEGLTDLHGVRIKNPSPLEAATMQVKDPDTSVSIRYTIPPTSSFVLGNLSASHISSHVNISAIPGLPSTEKFNIILFDPPWPNRSVRRSSQYLTHGYLEMDSLVSIIQQTIISHLSDDNTRESMVGIWTTNNAKSRQAAYDAFSNTGLEIFEIWIWIKTTKSGELVSPLDGLWRKPYEVLFLGRPKMKTEKAHKEREPIKRVIVAVPDEHSRKPNLKELLELLFFNDEENETRDTPIKVKEYTALEVFARNLTAGWCACGNDVLKFNAGQWWYQP